MKYIKLFIWPSILLLVFLVSLTCSHAESTGQTSKTASGQAGGQVKTNKGTVASKRAIKKSVRSGAKKKSRADILATLDYKNLYDEYHEEELAEVGEVVFAVRQEGFDGHWYANFGYYAKDENKHPFPLGTGGKLCILNLKTRQVRTIFEDSRGSVRDPVVHYDAKKILFSYIPSGKKHYNLYEINTDGTGLRQLTDGPWDDIEPTYLPNDDIVFCSSRCKRWVQCWTTGVATVYRCGPNGENIRQLSCNVEQDNTPWVLPNGQVLYMRWEYVDRNQVSYHHLWTMNPDGTRQMVFFGNSWPGGVYIDAKPIPGSSKIILTNSPGHGKRDHYGKIAILDPKSGSDTIKSLVAISKANLYTDPWAFSERLFMAASYDRLILVDANGAEENLYVLPTKEAQMQFMIAEPRPLIKREREHIVPDGTDPGQTHGNLLLTNIYTGRQMQDVPKGSVKELLVLETLPEPIHYSGGMDQISYKGTFTLERILGTVPVSPEGTAWFEAPALRPLFFIAMDHEGKAIKRMHSFTSVMPGETTSCIGCHETRIESPDNTQNNHVFPQMAGGPAKIKPIPGIPVTFDFARDIQPILDKHCLECHQPLRAEGNVNLSGDWLPLYSQSYFTLCRLNMLGDNRNRTASNFKPYQIGSCASSLYKLILEHHEGVQLSKDELTMVKYWLESGGNYSGTYAAGGTGQIGWFYMNSNQRNDLSWPETKAMGDAITRRCTSCHPVDDLAKNLPRSLSEDRNDVHQYERYLKRHDYYNLSRPEYSKMLRAPLAVEQGGLGLCRSVGNHAVFKDKTDPDYQTILAGIQRGKDYILLENNRFTMKPFVPDRGYIREMIRYGVLPKNHDFKSPVDPYKLDQKYWELLHYKPVK